MAGQSVPIVLVPRFTTFVGAGPFFTHPIPISAYDTAVIVAWRNPGIGTVASFTFAFQESNDLSTWTDCTGTPGGDPGGVLEVTFTENLTRAWLRVRMDLIGSNPGVTCWAEGFLLLRER